MSSKISAERPVEAVLSHVGDELAFADDLHDATEGLAGRTAQDLIAAAQRTEHQADSRFSHIDITKPGLGLGQTLESVKDGREDVDLDRLLARCFRLLYALAEVLQHLQPVFVSNVWEHKAVETNRTVNHSDTERQGTRYRLTLKQQMQSRSGSSSNSSSNSY